MRRQAGITMDEVCFRPTWQDQGQRLDLKGYSGVSLIHVLTHSDTEYDPPREIKFADR